MKYSILVLICICLLGCGQSTQPSQQYVLDVYQNGTIIYSYVFDAPIYPSRNYMTGPEYYRVGTDKGIMIFPAEMCIMRPK